MKPFVSICIPAYKHEQYLQRLFDSIAEQTFRDFEVVVTDDSDDLSVQNLIEKYREKFVLRYFKNAVPLGMPANWNKAIASAKGEWIKLMHDDDWFADRESLKIFADYTSSNNKFIVSAYMNCYEANSEKNQIIEISNTWTKKLLSDHNVLFARNVIGPPSVTLIHNSIKQEYNEQLRWRVDIEYYIKVLNEGHNITFINQPLINIGLSDLQVTNSCFNNPAVELPEGFFLLEKYGVTALKNIWVYDAWWRLLRNMGIRSKNQLKQYVNKEWPPLLIKIVQDLSRVNKTLIKNGIVSKTLMTLSYLKNISSIN
jgi:glycosyltransferase involved in cell wall biosynthesis